MKFTMTVPITAEMTAKEIDEAYKTIVYACHHRAAKLAQCMENLTVDRVTDKSDEGEEIEKAVFTAECIEAPHLLIICELHEIAKATRYADKVWPKRAIKPEVVTNMLELNRVHVFRSIPYTVLPKTRHQMWHTWLAYHERAGRIIRVEPDKEPLAGIEAS